MQTAEVAVQIARDFRVPLVINDRVDVALAIDADGVHVGQSDMPASQVRRILGPHKIVGVSAKTPEHAQKAFEDGADYLGVGGVYATTTKLNNTTIGLEGLRRVGWSSKLPIVAIGGINLDNVEKVMSSGARQEGVAVVSAVFDQADVCRSNKGHEGQDVGHQWRRLERLRRGDSYAKITRR